MRFNTSRPAKPRIGRQTVFLIVQSAIDCNRPGLLQLIGDDDLPVLPVRTGNGGIGEK
jgi:hypothetical protein